MTGTAIAIVVGNGMEDSFPSPSHWTADPSTPANSNTMLALSARIAQYTSLFTTVIELNHAASHDKPPVLPLVASLYRALNLGVTLLHLASNVAAEGTYNI